MIHTLIRLYTMLKGFKVTVKVISRAVHNPLTPSQSAWPVGASLQRARATKWPQRAQLDEKVNI